MRGWEGGELPKTCGNLLSPGNLSLPNIKKWRLHLNVSYANFFSSTDDVWRITSWLFAECSSHSRMVFTSPQEYIYIERSHRFCMPHFDVNGALKLFYTMIHKLQFTWPIHDSIKFCVDSHLIHVSIHGWSRNTMHTRVT